MPRPTIADRHVDQLLSTVGMAFWQDANNYCAMKVFPRAPVTKQSGYYRTYSVDELLRLQATKIPPGVESPEDTGGWSDTQYFCEKYGLKDYLTPEDLANDDGPIDPEQVVTQSLVQAHLTTMERAWASAYFGLTTWNGGTDWTGKATTPSTNEFLQWNVATSDPVQDVLNAKEVIADKVGPTYAPNVAVIERSVYNALKVNSSIMDRIKYSGIAGIGNTAVSRNLLAQLFEVDEVIIAGAVYNAAKEGATASPTKIFSDRVLLVYRAPNPSPRQPSAGYTFVWSTPTDAPPGTEVVVRKIPNPLKGNRTDYEGIIYWQQKVTASSLGILLDDVLK